MPPPTCGPADLHPSTRRTFADAALDALAGAALDGVDRSSLVALGDVDVTCPSTPPTPPAPRLARRWLACRQQTQTPESAHSSPTPEDPADQASSSSATTGKFNEEINRRFDLVSWDPRGVGGTAPLQCGSGFADTFLSTDLAPRDAAGRTVLEESLAANVEACLGGRCVAPRPHRHRRGSSGPRSDPASPRRRPDHLRRLLLRHPHRASLRRAASRWPAGDGARRRRPTRLRTSEIDSSAQAVSLDRSLAEVLNACGPDCCVHCSSTSEASRKRGSMGRSRSGCWP